MFYIGINFFNIFLVCIYLRIVSAHINLLEAFVYAPIHMNFAIFPVGYFIGFEIVSVI